MIFNSVSVLPDRSTTFNSISSLHFQCAIWNRKKKKECENNDQRKIKWLKFVIVQFYTKYFTAIHLNHQQFTMEIFILEAKFDLWKQQIPQLLKPTKQQQLSHQHFQNFSLPHLHLRNLKEMTKKNQRLNLWWLVFNQMFSNLTFTVWRYSMSCS